MIIFIGNGFSAPQLTKNGKLNIDIIEYNTKKMIAIFSAFLFNALFFNIFYYCINLFICFRPWQVSADPAGI